MNPDLIIGGIWVPLLAGVSVQQSYTELKSGSVRRAADGTAIAQCVWRGKWATSIQCSGHIPPALQSLNWAEPHTIDCIQPREVQAVGLTATLPAARRPDIPATAVALIGTEGGWRETGVTVVGNLATLSAVSGAAAYRVRYFPRLICYAVGLQGPDESWSGGNSFSWSLDLEEI